MKNDFFEFFAVYAEVLNGSGVRASIRDQVRRATPPKSFIPPLKRAPATQLSGALWLYFHEVYIWVERVKMLSWIIGGCYDWTLGEVSKVSDTLVGRTAGAASKRLKRELDARNDHVHRLHFTDDDLRRLSALELLLTLDFRRGDPNLLLHYRSEFSKTRRSWVRRIEASEALVSAELDACSSVWTKMLFSSDGRWILPAAPSGFVFVTEKRRKRLRATSRTSV
jgi:hypothetical protein